MKRFAMTVLLKNDPEIIRKYEEFHANPWPEVIESGYDCGIRRVFIYRYGHQLFMFLETVDDCDLGGALQKCLLDPKLRQWDEIMREMQEPVPGAPKDAKWVQMKEIHAVENGKVIELGD